MTWAIRIALLLLLAAAAHLAVMVAAPQVIMRTAFARIEAGSGVNVWRHAPRITHASRAIVRPSPDLAYSSCVYDVSGGPVRIAVGPSADYWSLSLYGANSDNFFVVNDRQAPRGAEIVVVTPNQTPPEGARAIVSPSTRGVALVRRLAPNAESFAAADAARRNDVCAPLS